MTKFHISCQYFDPDQGDKFYCENDPAHRVLLEISGSVDKEVIRMDFCDEHFKKLDKGILRMKKNAPDLVIKVLEVKAL